MKRSGWFFMVFTSAVLFGCMDDDALWDFERPDPPVSYEGVFIVNEGNFMYGNASLSYYDMESGEVFNDVFFNANAMPLGDVAQSMVIRDSLAYVVVNNSGKVVVMNVNTFEYVSVIGGLTSPRYMHFVDDTKAYVSDLYAKSIAVVNPQTFEVTASIDVSLPESGFYRHSTEQMFPFGKYVFVNCWSFDNSILVIDSETDEWIETIEVLVQPNSMVMDNYGKLWVLADGGFPGSPFAYEEPGLMRIDAATRQIEHTYRFELGDRPLALSINGTGDTLFYINRHVFRHDVTSADAPEKFIESPYTTGYAGGFSALGVDPVSSNIYVADAIDYMQSGRVYRYAPDAELADSFRVGIIPGEFVFRPR